MIGQLTAALEPDDVVLGGGNVKTLEGAPCRLPAGDNANAFLGGFRLWEDARRRRNPPMLPRREWPSATNRSSAMKAGIYECRQPPLKQRLAWKALKPTTRKSGVCICASCSPTTPSAASA